MAVRYGAGGGFISTMILSIEFLVGSVTLKHFQKRYATSPLLVGNLSKTIQMLAGQY